METLEQPPLPEVEPPPVQKLQVGPDRVVIEPHQVVIDALHPMPDWQVREFCQIPIIFQDKKYFLRQKAASQKPYAMRYVLEPWGENNGNSASRELLYDAETVAQREQGVRSGHVDDIGRACLLLFYPFLGLLWFKTKEKLTRFCFVPRTITGVSCMTVFCFMFMDAIFAKLMITRSLRTGHLAMGGVLRAFWGQDQMDLGLFSIQVVYLDCLLFLLLLLDCIIRYSQHLGDSQTPWGFLEWLNPFRRKEPEQHS